MSRLLIEGGRILSFDPAVGDLETGTVLVEDGRIADVGPRVEAADAERLDASGCVVMPGFVDTHRHTWQTALRALCADWTLSDYFRGVRLTFSPRYTAADVYAGNLAGALEALDAGVTTILDFSHCVNTPEHADAAVEGLLDAGGRAVFAYGYFPTSGPEPVFETPEDRIRDAHRIREHHFSSADSLLTFGVALTETGLLPFAATRAEIDSANELDALLTAHTGCVWGSQLCMGVREMDAHGLLGPGQVHVHCNALSDEELGMLARAGSAVSSTPETEMQMGMGRPVIRRWLDLGGRPSLGCDVISCCSGDMFAQMRLGLQFQRCMDNDVLNARGDNPETLDLKARDALEWATTGGAEALGLSDRVGSLSPGKQADLIVVGGERPTMTALADPVGAMVLQAGAADVRDVLVAGRFAKRGGALTGDAARGRRLVEESRERLFESVLAEGPVLADAPPGFLDALSAAAEQNLAGAHA